MSNEPTDIQYIINLRNSDLRMNEYDWVRAQGKYETIGREFYKQIGQWLQNVHFAYKSIGEPQYMVIVPIVTARLNKYILSLPADFISSDVFRNILNHALNNCPNIHENILTSGLDSDIESIDDLYIIAFGETQDYNPPIREPLSLIERASILNILYGIDGLNKALVQILHGIFDEHMEHMLGYEGYEEYELPDITLEELNDRSNIDMPERITDILNEEHDQMYLRMHGSVLALFKDAIKTINPYFYKDIETGKLSAHRNAHRSKLNRTLNTLHENPLFYTPNRLLNSTVKHNVNINSRWYNTRNGATLKKIFRNKRINRTNKNTSESLNNNNKRNKKNNKATRRQRRNKILNKNL
jgi:hypothetical protein